MRDSKRKKAEYLLSEIGEIDDKFLLEAENYRPQKRLLRHRAFIAVACLCCFVVIVMSAILRNGIISNNSKGESIEIPNSEANNSINKGDEASSEESLFSDVEQTKSGFDLLLALQSNGRYGYDSFESIKREQGKTYILWQGVEGGRIFMSRAFSKDEDEYINEKLGAGDSVGESSPSLEFYVWILRGDGSIVSPYLKDNKGNIANALFEYEAEIMPQEDLIEFIAKILEDKY